MSRDGRAADAGRVVRGYIVPGMPQPLLAPEKSPAWRAVRLDVSRLMQAPR